MDQHAHSASPAQPQHAHGLSLAAKLALGTAALAGGIIVSPYLLPALGIGSEALAEETLTALCSTGEATGLAGSINGALAQIPLVGTSLAAGGWASVTAIAGVGLGGHFLANALSKGEDHKEPLRLSHIIRTMAITTSMLIALPSILTGISAGLVYLSALIGGTELASSTLTFMSDTLGTTGSTKTLTSGVTGLATTLPHLLTCGAALFPATLPWLMGGSTRTKARSRDEAMQMEVLSEGALQPGVSVPLLIRLRDGKTGAPIDPAQLDIIHENKLHLFVVSESLGEYHHLHPEPTGEAGVYRITFTPQSAESFHIWTQARQHERANTETCHAALASPTQTRKAFDFRPNQNAAAQGLRFAWQSSPPLRQGQESIISLTVTDGLGKLAALEPLLGAQAHVAGFSADGQHFVHLHPLDAAGDSTQPLRFHITPQHAGGTRFFVQVKHQGQEITARFDVAVHAAKTAAYAPTHAHTAQAAFAR